MKLKLKTGAFVLVFLVLSLAVSTHVFIRPVLADTENKYVNGYDSTYTAWTEVGSSPYLHDDDTSNYIYVTRDAYNEGYFTYADTTFTTITSVHVWFKAKIAAGGDDYVRVYNASGIQVGAIAPGEAYSWLQADTTGLAYINTVAEVNDFKVYLRSVKFGTIMSRIDITASYIEITGSSAVSYKLNLQTKDWDLTDNIQNAKVTMNNGSDQVKLSDSNGWANYTGISASSVTVKVSYYGFWVNGTFTITMDADKTITVRCKLYDVIIRVLESQASAYLVGANVTAFNSTSTDTNKIGTGISNNTGYVTLNNLPNNTLTFTVYAKTDWSLVIANTTQAITSEGQSFSITCNQNYLGLSVPWSIIGMGILLPKRKKTKNGGERKI